mmetsp:Transcript_8347/g.7474  ORF Transcript_8347/g.7474 Transcript_8347/m.7474 type:complete len:239 (-) Transcript_8347:64-780(-)
MSEVEAVADDQLPDEVAAMFDLTLKKKKKKKKTDNNEKTTTTKEENTSSNTNENIENNNTTNTVTSNPYGIELDPPTYEYSLLLNRVVDFLHSKDPAWSEKRRQTLKAPQLSRVGSKKTVWMNFQEICKMMHRNSDHVYQFMMAELGTEGSIDGTQRLVIRGKFVAKYIESLLRKYILEYVQCQMCRSFNTKLTRDSVSRLHFVECEDCKSTKSVQPIRAGYHAQTRADRRAIRNTTA